jgi:hypothetical protein
MSPLFSVDTADKVTNQETNQMPASTNLPNAPLVFVLGVVRISPYPNFGQKIENLHEALLDRFPEREPPIGGFSNIRRCNWPKVRTKPTLENLQSYFKLISSAE